MGSASVSRTPVRTHIGQNSFLRSRCGLHVRRGRFAHTGAGSQLYAVRVRSFTNVSILEHELHGLRRSLPCLPKKNGKSPKEETAAPSLRPETFAGHYPPESSLALLAQTGAPANATDESFSLRAPASVQRGGELHQCSSVSCIFQIHIPYAHGFTHEDADPHTLKIFLRRRCERRRENCLPKAVGADLHHGADDNGAVGIRGEAYLR